MAPSSFSEIAHTDHRFLSPFSAARAGRLIALLGLRPESRVLDLCCGRGEFLVRASELTGATGLGVDLSEQYIDAARAAAAERGVSHRIEFVVADVLAFEPGEGAFDAACWIGGAAQIGSFAGVASHLARAVRPGGHVFIAELFWQHQPEADHIATFFAGSAEGGLLGHAANATAGQATGLTLLHSETSSTDDWDDYEGLRLRAVERCVHEHPGDPRALAFRDRIREEYREYLSWRRDALGFGFYIYRK